MRGTFSLFMMASITVVFAAGADLVQVQKQKN